MGWEDRGQTRLEQTVEEGRPRREVDPEGGTQQEWEVQGVLVGPPVLGSQQCQALCQLLHIDDLG